LQAATADWSVAAEAPVRHQAASAWMRLIRLFDPLSSKAFWIRGISRRDPRQKHETPSVRGAAGERRTDPNGQGISHEDQ